MWQPIIDITRKRLSGWKGKLLSTGGKVTLINSVLSSLPLFYFSFFKAPKNVISKLESIQRSFFWGGGDERRKISWVSWNRICCPKERGGLGIRNLELFNVALLSKWRWKLVEGCEAPWFRLLSFRYGDPRSFIRGRNPGSIRNSSLWWRDIMSLSLGGDSREDWFSKLIRPHIGRGDKILFWDDAWCGSIPFSEAFPLVYSSVLDARCTVEDMGVWVDDVWQWDDLSLEGSTAMLEQRDLLALILRDIQLVRGSKDTWVWRPDPLNGFSVRSCYKELLEVWMHGIEDVDEVVGRALAVLWKCKIPSKCLIFAWRLFLDRLPTRDLLEARGVISGSPNLGCVFCFRDYENCSHIFFDCPFSKKVWQAVEVWVGAELSGTNNVAASHFLQFCNLVKKGDVGFVGCVWWISTVWCLWLHRNHILFKGGVADVGLVVRHLKVVSWDWFCISRKFKGVYGVDSWILNARAVAGCCSFS